MKLWAEVNICVAPQLAGESLRFCRVWSMFWCDVVSRDPSWKVWCVSSAGLVQTTLLMRCASARQISKFSITASGRYIWSPMHLVVRFSTMLKRVACDCLLSVVRGDVPRGFRCCLRRSRKCRQRHEFYHRLFSFRFARSLHDEATGASCSSLTPSHFGSCRRGRFPAVVG